MVWPAGAVYLGRGGNSDHGICLVCRRQSGRADYRLLGGKLWLQIVVFLAVSAVALALLRPIAKKYFTPRISRTNVDALIGKTCLCVTAIDNLKGCGQVKIGDVEGSARSTTGEPIA